MSKLTDILAAAVAAAEAEANRPPTPQSVAFGLPGAARRSDGTQIVGLWTPPVACRIVVISFACAQAPAPEGGAGWSALASTGGGWQGAAAVPPANAPLGPAEWIDLPLPADATLAPGESLALAVAPGDAPALGLLVCPAFVVAWQPLP